MKLSSIHFTFKNTYAIISIYIFYEEKCSYVDLINTTLKIYIMKVSWRV